MKTRTLFLYFLLAIISPLGSMAQSSEAAALLNTSKEYFEQLPVFKADLTYTLFRDKDRPVVIRSYDGELVKREEDIYLKIHNTEFLMQGGSLIKVNHDQKAIEYTAAKAGELTQNPIAIDQYLKLFATAKIEKKEGQTICRLSTPKYTQLPYGAIDLYFDSKDGSLRKQVLTLVNPGNIPNEKGQRDSSLKYLSIEFKEIEGQPDSIGALFDPANYISGSPKSRTAANTLSDYKLIDRSIK